MHESTPETRSVSLCKMPFWAFCKCSKNGLFPFFELAEGASECIRLGYTHAQSIFPKKSASAENCVVFERSERRRMPPKLTFDDGWLTLRTIRMTQSFEKNVVLATFFGPSPLTEFVEFLKGSGPPPIEARPKMGRKRPKIGGGGGGPPLLF